MSEFSLSDIAGCLSSGFYMQLPWYAVGMVLFLILWMWLLRWRDYAIPFLMYRRQRELLPVSSPVVDSAAGGKFADIPLGFRMVPPQVSVVVPCFNQLENLQSNLPALLLQENISFEVIIVDEASTDATREWIDHLSSQRPGLRYTFIPPSSRYVDRHKLAVTLGIRAARAPWVVVTRADCHPEGTLWLAGLAGHFHEDCDFVLGYAGYEECNCVRTRRASYERLRMSLRKYRAVLGVTGRGKGRAIGGDGCNFAVRKQHFMDCQGFAETLTVSCGETDLLVDNLAGTGRTELALHPETVVWQEAPVPEIIPGMRVAVCETIRHLSRRGRWFSLREGLASLGLYLLVAVYLLYAFRCILLYSFHPEIFPSGFVPDLFMLLLLLVSLLLPYRLLGRSLRVLGEENVPFGRMVARALLQPWRNMSIKVKRWKARHDFKRR